MTAIETKLLNAFETTLTAQMNPSDLTATVASTSTLASPAYLVIEPENPARREYVLFDGSFTATTFVCTGVGKRYLTGSAAASGLTHPVGSIVRMAPLAQHIEDLHDRIDALDHGTSLAGLGDDDHPQYSLVDGTRAFTAAVGGVTPTADAHLATKAYIDLLIPIGSIKAWPYDAVPNSKWMIADGSAISRATYATLHALAAAAGYPHGNGDGATTFNLPNLVGRAFYGKAASGTGSTLGGTFGSMDHTHTGPAHTHAVGSLAVANHAAHTHDTGTLAIPNHAAHTHAGPSHTHAPGTLAVPAHSTHTHAPGTLGIPNHDTHSHGVGSLSMTTDGSHTHGGTGSASGGNYVDGGSSFVVTVTSHTHTIPSSGSHTHTLSGSTGSTGGSDPSRVHGAITGATAADGPTTHDALTGATAAGGTGNTGNESATLTYSISGSTGNESAMFSHVVSGATAADGTGATGAGNPPGMAGLYIIRVA